MLKSATTAASSKKLKGRRKSFQGSIGEEDYSEKVLRQYKDKINDFRDLKVRIKKVRNRSCQCKACKVKGTIFSKLLATEIQIEMDK